jgi:hypothetical protein
VLPGCALVAADRPVPIDGWDVQAGTEQQCRALLAALPDTVTDAVRRETEPADLPAAAWGAPPIILRCGVPEPPRPLDTQLFTVDGVDWYSVEGDGGYLFSTVGRSAVVEVAVPDDYAPESDVLVDLAPALARTVPAT